MRCPSPSATAKGGSCLGDRGETAYSVAVVANLPRLPWPLRAANRAATALGRPHPSLDPDQLIASARRRTGLRDLGDPPVEEPLAILCADLDRGGLSPTGRIAARTAIDQLLDTRLEIAAQLARSPRAPIERPLFIVGLPRTGTTLLHRLLACDPSARWFSEADALYLPGTPRQRARVRMYRLVQRATSRLVGLAALHDRLDPTAPEEELPLLARTFVCPLFGMFCDLPTYDAWLAARDHATWANVYHYHRRQLELAQAAQPGGPFVLKSPAHIPGLAALLEVHEDALIVQTDRDPVEVASSLLSLELHSRALFLAPERYDAAAAGRCLLDYLARSLDRLEKARQSAPDRVVTVPYVDLIADPLATVRRIYDAWDRSLTAAAAARMIAFLAQTQRRRATRPVRLESWGLADADVRRALAARTADGACAPSTTGDL
jgi:hypothetical protein